MNAITRVVMAKYSSFGAVMTNNPMTVMRYVEMYPFMECECKSFANSIDAYWYMCNRLAKLRWQENPYINHPMPTYDMMLKYEWFFDYNQIKPFAIRQDRYFGVITTKGNMALLDKVSDLAGFLNDCSNALFEFKEFNSEEGASQWIAEKTGVSLRARGAYIQMMNSLRIPKAGEVVPLPEYTVSPDIPVNNYHQIQNAIDSND